MTNSGLWMDTGQGIKRSSLDQDREIARRCNNYQQLVEALEEAVQSFRSEYNDVPASWEKALKKVRGEK